MRSEFPPSIAVAATQATPPTPAARTPKPRIDSFAAGVDSLSCKPGVIGCLPTHPSLPVLPMLPATPDPATALADLTRASRKGAWISVPMHGVTASLSLQVQQTDEGFQIQRRFSGCFGGSTTTIAISYADLTSGRLSREAAQALRDLHDALQPQAPAPIAPPPGFPPPGLPTAPTIPVWPGGTLPSRFPTRSTDRSDLIQAAWQGTLHDRRGNTLSVSLTQTGYQIQVTDRFGLSPARTTHVAWKDLERGSVTAQQRLTLDLIHQALEDQRPSAPTPVGPSWPPGITLEPSGGPIVDWLPLPADLPRIGRPPAAAGERVTVTDIEARIKDLEAGAKRGSMGSTGCTSMGGALSVTRTADGYTLTSASGGFITHRNEVSITIADLRKGTLTQEQLNALDNLRSKLQTAPTGTVLF